MRQTFPISLSLITVLCLACSGCKQEQQQSVGNTRLQSTLEEPAANVGRTPDLDIVRAANGTVIKRSGWHLPVELPKEKQYHSTTVIIDGRSVEVLNSPYLPTEKPVVRIPKFWEDGELEYKIIQIIEFTDARKRPYCYQLFADQSESPKANPAAAGFFSYLDSDGDGVFETLSQEGCRVPDWVK